MNDEDDRYSIAFDEALRAIADQQTTLDSLQARAGTVVSAAAITGGLLAFGSPQDEVGVSAVVAMALLAAIVVFGGLIIWPQREWRFHFLSSDLLWNYIEGPAPLTSKLMRRDLSLYLEAYFHSNAKKLDALSMMLAASIIFLFLEAAAVLFEIKGG